MTRGGTAQRQPQRPPAGGPPAPAHPLTPRFQEALAWAFTLHRAQPRKGVEIPYFSHLMAVTALVLEHRGTETEAIAALLHDAPEDQGGRPTLEAIRTRFGDEVATIVEGCSDTFERPKPPWPERKKAYLEHLRATDNLSTLLVSMADKTHNLERIVADAKLTGPALWDRFGVLTDLDAAGLSRDEIRAKKREAQRWYYGELIAIYRQRSGEQPRVEPLAGRLEGAFGALQEIPT